LSWDQPFTSVSNGSGDRGDFSWFHGGKLNVSYNCIDCHAFKTPSKIAIIFEADTVGEHEYISYSELLANVCQVANLLDSYGLKPGDNVVIYMPMVPQAAYAMLACARLGLVHCVVFAGFSAGALRDRINDSGKICFRVPSDELSSNGICLLGAKVVFTTDENRRGGKSIKLKPLVDSALLECQKVQRCVVYQRTGTFGTPMHTPRDVWWHEVVSNQRAYCYPVSVPSEHALCEFCRSIIWVSQNNLTSISPSSLYVY
jgi:acetyl-CoA synthetase